MKKRKLKLKTETVRRLDKTTIRQVVGGWTETDSCICDDDVDNSGTCDGNFTGGCGSYGLGCGNE